jgi:hypothetical protein
MSFSRNDFKIFGSIIEFVTVDMVDILTRFELSSKLLLHDIAAYIDLLAVYAHLAISRLHQIVWFGCTFLWHSSSKKDTTLPDGCICLGCATFYGRVVMYNKKVATILDEGNYTTA